MVETLHLKNAQELLKLIEAYKPAIVTPFDHSCAILNLFFKLLIEQHIIEMKGQLDAQTKRK